MFLRFVHFLSADVKVVKKFLDQEKVLDKAKSLTDQQLMVLSKLILEKAKSAKVSSKAESETRSDVSQSRPRKKVDVDFSYHVTSDAGL